MNSTRWGGVCCTEVGWGGSHSGGMGYNNGCYFYLNQMQNDDTIVVILVFLKY